MKQDVRLFINGREIEFSANPKILLNYKEKELHNPTIVKNSFTKQITVEGTPANNLVFDHIWSLERIQDNNFNPIRKTDFQLYVNDELFQKGYVKLDKITRTNNTIKYSMTLYGNLGAFFYNLTYNEDDYGNSKKSLASLFFRTEYEQEPNLDFEITKENVYEAWGQLAGFGTGYNNRWNIINFIPALNGIPGDFDASKILINNHYLNGGFENIATDGGNTYMPVLNGTPNMYGWSLGETDGELQEWQTRDLRSYNQRPCINMQRIIEACCQPENNGGFQVKLDSHFFNVDNPYYQNAWVTLPMLKDLEGVQGGETYDITGATLSNPSTQYDAKMYSVLFNTPPASINNVNMNVSVRFTPNMATAATNLYPGHTYSSTVYAGKNYVRNAEVNSGVVLQMFALGQGGSVVGQSKAYLVGGNQRFYKKGDSMWNEFWNPDGDYGDIGSQPDYEFLEGYFKKIGGTYVFVNNDGEPTDINFSFIAPSDFVSVVLKVKTPYGYYAEFGRSGIRGSSASGESDYNSYLTPCYTTKATSTTDRQTLNQALERDRVTGNYDLVITSMEGVATDYEGLFSGTKITKERLLTTQYTPGDYLLSYCKLFGLYFYYDSTEDPDDLEKYPAGVVHIMDRDTFYTDEVKDLSQMIDWSKNMDIIPAMANSKWYKFDVGHVESELETGYKEQFGREYGSQYINTNYNFDNNTTNLYDGNVFKGATMALEKDKYYRKTVPGLPVYQYNGLKYNLFYRETSGEEFETYEIEYPVTTTMHMVPVNSEYPGYDSFPKLQLHGEDNAAADGADVLVFLNGYVQTSTDYWVTDDITEMITLNDASPCWIMTNSEEDGAGQTIAKRVNYFPYFTRDLTLIGNYGNVVHSWNFGHPRVIYSPNTYSTEGDSIYDVCWQNYISDLYNVDTRKLTCYVRAEMDDRPWPYWFRRFYWFENSIWMLNEIKDLNPGDFGVTKMEFIKVQDMDNYKLDRITWGGTNYMVLDVSSVPCSGGSATGSVHIQGAGTWHAADYIQGIDGYGNNILLESSTHMSPTSGSGASSNFTVTVPSNTVDTSIVWTITVIDDFDNRLRASFDQGVCDAPPGTISISPAQRTVSSPSGYSDYTLTVTNVSGLTAVCSEGWATATISGTRLRVSYQRNTDPASRTVTITVSGTSGRQTVSASATLSQNGVGNIISTQNVEIDYGNTSWVGFELDTYDDWTSSIIDNN